MSENRLQLLTPGHNTLTIHDILYISLPREKVEYSGKDYRTWVSGFRPCLDSLQIYPQQQIITNTVTGEKSSEMMGYAKLAK